jgi:hypothetical protein
LFILWNFLTAFRRWVIDLQGADGGVGAMKLRLFLPLPLNSQLEVKLKKRMSNLLPFRKEPPSRPLNRHMLSYIIVVSEEGFAQVAETRIVCGRPWE